MYRYCWENQQCVIPIDGFFEPHNTNVKGKGKDVKIPFYFRSKNGDSPYLVSIYTNTSDGRRTFAVLTKDATPMFEEIHNEKKRRSVIIDDKNLDAWLHNGNNEPDVQDLIDDDLWEGDPEAYPVAKDLYSRSVNSNYPSIIDKVNHEEVSISYR